ncbi:hypothetical protein BKA57DRAFT_539423 [Linnemannia elongata]|nr:hypothetical protein BKA57DRAFT_539423 [Linnemannia elongata]
MLAPTVFAVLLLCLSPASATGEIPPSNSGEEPIDLYKCDFRQDPHYGQLLAFARRGLPKEMFFGTGVQVPEYVFVQRQDPAEIMGVRAICYGDHMAPVVPSGPVAEWRDLICPVPGAPFDGKSFPTCKVRNLVIKAQLRVEQLGFDNSKTDRTETVDKTFTTNFVIKGEVTMAPTFFKVFGLEATASGEYSKQAIVRTTTVKGVKAGYSATFRLSSQAEWLLQNHSLCLTSSRDSLPHTQGGYTTPIRCQGLMRFIIPLQVPQPPIMHHILANLLALLNGSLIRLNRSASFSNNPAQGVPAAIAAAQFPILFGHASQTAFAQPPSKLSCTS